MEQLHSNTFPLEEVAIFKNRMLNWLRRFNIFSLLDNQDYSLPHQTFDMLVGAGCRRWHQAASLEGLNNFLAPGQWYFGHLAYNLADDLYGMPLQEDPTGFAPLSFFQPEIVLAVQAAAVTIYAAQPAAVFSEIIASSPAYDSQLSEVLTTPTVDRDTYIEDIGQVQHHIRRGDCYELNYCLEFSGCQKELDPWVIYQHLMQHAPAPFSVFYRLHDRYLVCGSPERFLKREGRELISQPMKGTARRLADAAADREQQHALVASEKERAENVMIVDLVRNDLARVCDPATVKASSLFSIQSFPQVHQLVSTVAGRLKPEAGYQEIFAATFPMGSMTGAPKKRVLELIRHYERAPRGIFSGAVGYIQPSGNFDFNVVIRSIMYHSGSGLLRYLVGSGITTYSQPAQEWEECMLKAAGIKKVLT